jgi:hypothetical protein
VSVFLFWGWAEGSYFGRKKRFFWRRRRFNKTLNPVGVGVP